MRKIEDNPSNNHSNPWEQHQFYKLDQKYVSKYLNQFNFVKICTPE